MRRILAGIAAIIAFMVVGAIAYALSQDSQMYVLGGGVAAMVTWFYFNPEARRITWGRSKKSTAALEKELKHLKRQLPALESEVNRASFGVTERDRAIYGDLQDDLKQLKRRILEIENELIQRKG